MYVNDNNVTYFDSFGDEHIPKEIRKFIWNNNMKTNIYRTQVYDSIMCGYFCIGLFDFMLKVKRLLAYTNLISLNKYKRNDIIMLKCFIEIKNYLIEEINQSELMSKKHKKVCRVLHYIDHLLIATITITECVSISAFVSLVGIPKNCKFYNRIKNFCNNCRN